MKMIFKNKMIVILLAVVFFSACTSNQNEGGETDNGLGVQAQEATGGLEKKITFTAEQYRLAGIETGKIEMRNLSSIIKLSGKVEAEPKGIATVSAPLGGYLKTAGLVPGQPVKEGQVIATLENPAFIDMQQDYLEGKGRLLYLEKEYDRQKNLREQDINAEKTFQQVASEYKIMQARISALEQKMALAGINVSNVTVGNISRTANLYAPISGFIKTSNVNIGNYVSPNDVLFEIVNTGEVHLSIDAFEKDLVFLKEGQTVKFSLANEYEYNRSAKISLIGKSTGKERIIPVYCPIRQEDQKGLLPGMYVKAWIETDTDRLPAAPAEAIVQLEGADYLVFLENETPDGYIFRLEQIKKGIEQEGFTSVALANTDKANEAKLVIKNAYTILSALRNTEEGD